LAIADNNTVQNTDAGVEASGFNYYQRIIAITANL